MERSSPNTRSIAAIAFALAVTDPTTLARLDAQGLSFTNQLGGYLTSFKELLSREITEQNDRAREAHPDRSKDARFFVVETLAEASWELAGILHRPDRAWHSGSPCGEVRLLYRPREKRDGGERLPVTISLVHAAKQLWPDLTCREIATRFKIMPSTTPAHAATSYMAVHSPGSAMRQKAAKFVRIEANALTSRWLTTADPSVSDQSHYLMLAFAPDARSETLNVVPLEMTPDIELFSRDRISRRTLINWLASASVVPKAEVGKLQIPERFLAKRAVSVAPRGSERLANRPFSALFDVSEVAGALARAGGDPTIAKRYLRRLDSLTCVGCHQSASLAGFHFLGIDGKSQTPAMLLSQPFSALFERLAPFRIEATRDLAEGNTLPPLPIVDDGVLKQDSRVRSSAIAASGDACDETSLTSAKDSLRDKLGKATLKPCASPAYCAPSRSGFPGGMCGAPCTGAAATTSATLCTSVPTLGPFSECVDKGGSIRDCAKQHNISVGMKRCAAHSACRSDYACVMDGDRRGYCAPTYFVPELAGNLR